MKGKFTLFTFVILAWGSMTQAWGQYCSCTDKETLSINQAYHQGSLAVANAVLGRLQNPAVIEFAKATIAEDQAKLKELDSISVNAGIPYKPSDLSKGFEDRAKAKIAQLATLSGAELDQAYLDYRWFEAQLMITATDTYFIPKESTPTMKAWVVKERARFVTHYDSAKSIQSKIGGVALFY